jgi:hypothetical protein
MLSSSFGTGLADAAAGAPKPPSMYQAQGSSEWSSRLEIVTLANTSSLPRLAPGGSSRGSGRVEPWLREDRAVSLRE